MADAANPGEPVGPPAGLPVPTFSARVLRGFSWRAGSMAFSFALSLLRTVILARLIPPREYGLFGMATTALSAMAAVTTLGLDTIYIISDRPDDSTDRDYLDTIWTADLIRRLAMTLLLILIAYPISLFYGESRVTWLIVILAAVPVLQGLQNPATATLRRSLAFGRVVALEQFSNVVSLIVAVVLAVTVSRSASVLVATQVVGVLLTAGSSYWIIGYRPAFKFDARLFKHAWKNGRYVALTAVLTFGTTMLDNVFVGRMIGASALGIYVMAYTLATLPLTLVTSITGSVLMSAYAEKRRQEAHELESYVSASLVVSVCWMWVFYAPLAVFASDAVVLIFGSRWEAAGPVIPVLCVLAFFRGLATFFGGVLIGAGESPRSDAIPKIAEVALMVALLGPLVIAFGLRGAAVAGTAAYAVAAVWRFLYLKRLFPNAARRVFIALMQTGAVASGLAAVVFAVSRRFDQSRYVPLIAGMMLAVMLVSIFAALVREAKAGLAAILSKAGINE